MGLVKHFSKTDKVNGKPMDSISFAARLHAALISVHPFLDGNGRSIAYFSLALMAAKGDYPMPVLTEDRVKIGRFHHVQLQGTGNPTVPWEKVKSNSAGGYSHDLNNAGNAIAAYISGALEMLDNLEAGVLTARDKANWEYLTSKVSAA